MAVVFSLPYLHLRLGDNDTRPAPFEDVGRGRGWADVGQAQESKSSLYGLLHFLNI